MWTDHYFDSCGKGRIHYCRWDPEGEVKGIVQFVHGIAEMAARYDTFAKYLNGLGYLVVAEDHMGHGASIGEEGIQGYFHGGWHTAVADTKKLMDITMAEFPGVPYVLFGHSMGSFMARTILCEYPDSGISAAIICGTAWQPTFALPALIKVIGGICKKEGETAPGEMLNKLIFGSYNNKVEHKRTTHDWLSRDEKIVDAYIADPLCGFVPTNGLLRDMMTGIYYIQRKENLQKMRKDLPVFFIAGGDDPVGSYGKGVRQAAEEFKKIGMTDVSLRIYPLCRHEIHNEINADEVFEDVAQWLAEKL